MAEQTPQTIAVEYMFCDAMVCESPDWEHYRKRQRELEVALNDEFGEGWSENTANWATGMHMTSTETLLWPVANWSSFQRVARGELKL